MVIIALDFKDMETSLKFLDQFNESLYVKVGMELFYGSGLEIIKEIKKRGHKIFLDLKLHDIPNTVKKAMTNLAKLGVDLINLHAAGGSIMMKAAMEGLIEGSNGNRPLLIAVTQLTSTSKEMMNNEQLIPGEVIDSVVNYAKVAKEAGLDGIVCSPLEVKLVKEVCGNKFITVTPGIRLASNNKDDQVRITTPSMAREIGSDFIVVGRPITQAENPVEAYKLISKEFLGNE
jgi:orotidine-5'-phosphate decarboxylase